MRLPLYFDYNATTPVDSRVLQTMLPWFTEQFGNAASSTHEYGWAAAEAVKIAREKIASFLSATPEEIVFTSGATEAINMALKGVFLLHRSRGNHILTCATEHRAVLDTLSYLESEYGARVTRLPVDSEGRPDTEAFREALTPDTVLAAVMLANNETGRLHPVSELAAIARERSCFFFCDATQAAGKIPVSVEHLGVDLLACSAHKMYGPKGVGALYVRRRNPRVTLLPLLHGGGHEKGRRNGTLNVPGIVGFGKAAELCAEYDGAAVARRRDALQAGILSLPGTRLNASGDDRLPNTLSVCFPGIHGDALIEVMRNLAVSHGSACSSAEMEPSHVLTAMGLTAEEAYASVRFSTGRSTSDEEIAFAVQEVDRALQKLRG